MQLHRPTTLEILKTLAVGHLDLPFEEEAQAKEIEALKLQFDTAWVHESEIPR